MLLEVIKLAPNVAESYHTLALVFDSLQDKKTAMSFFLIAAHLDSKYSSYWEIIYDWSMWDDFSVLLSVIFVKLFFWNNLATLIHTPTSIVMMVWNIMYVLLSNNAERNIMIIELWNFFKCRKQDDYGQARYCLLKAIRAYPKNITLRCHLAELYVKLGDYQKAAVTYEQVHQLCYENVDALKMAVKVSLCFEIPWTWIQFCQ